jgi:hypothetical protein
VVTVKLYSLDREASGALIGSRDAYQAVSVRRDKARTGELSKTGNSFQLLCSSHLRPAQLSAATLRSLVCSGVRRRALLVMPGSREVRALWPFCL